MANVLHQYIAPIILLVFGGMYQGAKPIDVHIATTHNNANALAFKLIGHLLLNVIITEGSCRFLTFL